MLVRSYHHEVGLLRLVDHRPSPCPNPLRPALVDRDPHLSTGDVTEWQRLRRQSYLPLLLFLLLRGVGFNGGIFSLLFHRPVGNTLEFLLLFLRPHGIVVGAVHRLPWYVLGQVDAPRHAVGTHKSLHKVTNVMKR
jgi:hypothetical protein